MSKFNKPKPTEAAIKRVITGAEADDSRSAESDIRFTMSLSPPLADQVDTARKELGLTRLAWLRLAAIEKLKRDNG